MRFTEPTLEEKILKTEIILKNGYANLFSFSYTTFYKAHDANNLIYKPYIFTNENLNYFKNLTDFSGKKVLVPTASGDHAFNALFLGAESVETFDINSIAKYFFNLKETAIRYLSRTEFLEFYSDDNLLNETLYNKIKIKLKTETRSFFNALFKIVKENNCLINTFFEETYMDEEKIIKSNPYLENEKSYLKLKNILLQHKKAINHKVCPAENIVENFDKKDVIILSNIYGAYLLMHKNEMNFNRYLKNIPQLLTDDGTVSLNYIFGCTSNENKKYLMKEIRKEVPTNNKIEINAQRFTHYDKTKDTVLCANKEDIITR